MYVDGYLLPVPKKKLKAYRRMAQSGGKLWKKYGALEFRECAGDDLKAPWGMPFPKIVKTKPGETVVFSWIVFKSKAHRNQVNAKVMNDASLSQMDPKDMPFDMKRMGYGGFKILVDL
jgi:uncharacterized protein YbaA (DUF1428 family)